MILISYKASRYFGVRLRRKHRFGSFARVASPNAAYVEAGAAAIALESAVALFAKYGVHINGFAVGLLREGYLSNHISLFLREGYYIIVEVRYRNASLLIHHLGNDF